MAKKVLVAAKDILYPDDNGKPFTKYLRGQVIDDTELAAMWLAGGKENVKYLDDDKSVPKADGNSPAENHPPSDDSPKEHATQKGGKKK